METKLPNNLRVTKGGQIYCEDGAEVESYLKASPLFTKRVDDPPNEIVIVSRKDFLRLCQEAWQNENFILAA